MTLSKPFFTFIKQKQQKKQKQNDRTPHMTIKSPCVAEYGSWR
jgi:hypothetical protein